MASTTGTGGGTPKHAAIRGAVIGYITAHGLTAGDPLPPESRLMEELGVSRNALREAMKSLQAVGIIDIRHGFGTYVGTSSLRPLEVGLAYRAARSVNGDLREILDLLEVREIVETGLADRVLNEVSDTTELGRIVSDMESAGSGGAFAGLDWRFHEALYAPLGNEFVVELLRVFWTVFTSIEPELPGRPYTLETAASWHRDIYEAMLAHDRGAYLAAFGRHFADIRSRVRTAVDSAPPEPTA
jgi:DNA-binding FadR family transcriptional regulator